MSQDKAEDDIGTEEEEIEEGEELKMEAKDILRKEKRKKYKLH